MSKILKVGPFVFGAALSVILSLATPVLATENVNEEASVEEDANERICRRVMVTGSRIMHRICMKRSEWVEQSAQNREEAEMMLEGSDQNYDLVTEQDASGGGGPPTDGSRGY